MNILGTLYTADDPNFVRAVLYNPQFAANTIVMSMDEEDDSLEREFPDRVQVSTILCAPPSAIYKDIDGNHEEFITDYNEYLDSPPVTEFIAAVLAHMHRGGNILLYIPEFTEDSIWVNVLLINLFTRFGITVGMSKDKNFEYDPKYDAVIANIIYSYGYIDIIDYMNSNPEMFPPYELCERVAYDLAPYCLPGENGVDVYARMKQNQLMTMDPSKRLIIPAMTYIPNNNFMRG